MKTKRKTLAEKKRAGAKPPKLSKYAAKQNKIAKVWEGRTVCHTTVN